MAGRGRRAARGRLIVRALDLFCGGGGVSVGLARAGWQVTGVDLIHHEDYPDDSHGLWALPGVPVCEFCQGDALEVVRDRDYLAGFDLVCASPPCPGYSTITPDPTRHPRLIEPIRRALADAGVPYIIENVEGARDAMIDPVMLCGSSFQLGVRRHRLFESNLDLTAPPCRHDAQPQPVGVYGSHPEANGVEYRRGPTNRSRGRRAATLGEAQRAMGIDWLRWDDLRDAIPPAYSQHLGEQALALLSARVA